MDTLWLDPTTTVTASNPHRSSYSLFSVLVPSGTMEEFEQAIREPDVDPPFDVVDAVTVMVGTPGDIKRTVHISLSEFREWVASHL